VQLEEEWPKYAASGELTGGGGGQNGHPSNTHSKRGDGDGGRQLQISTSAYESGPETELGQYMRGQKERCPCPHPPAHIQRQGEVSYVRSDGEGGIGQGQRLGEQHLCPTSSAQGL
jgi:hypothetical protein